MHTIDTRETLYDGQRCSFCVHPSPPYQVSITRIELKDQWTLDNPTYDGNCANGTVDDTTLGSRPPDLADLCVTLDVHVGTRRMHAAPMRQIEYLVRIE